MRSFSYLNRVSGTRDGPQVVSSSLTVGSSQRILLFGLTGVGAVASQLGTLPRPAARGTVRLSSIPLRLHHTVRFPALEPYHGGDEGAIIGSRF